MSLEQESYLLCWQAEMSARRLRSALGALRNVHDDFRPCQEVHDAVADYLRSAERAASERGHHYKWLTGGKKYTSPRATDGPPDQMDEDSDDYPEPDGPACGCIGCVECRCCIVCDPDSVGCPDCNPDI